MKSAIEQSIKEKIKALAKNREITFAELWRNLILERFLSRLAHSIFRDKFVLKGGSLLAKYLYIGRETQDLDFYVQKLANTKQSLQIVLQAICDIDIQDSFTFEISKIKILDHIHLAYTGAEISLLVKFGATKTIMRMDLGFGDCVEPIDYPIELTTTSKGPLFESRISLWCYPKEFIFAEKSETVVFRGASTTRVNNHHDKHGGFLMPTAKLSRSLTTVGLPSNLLYPCKQRGLHPDGLHRARQPMATPHSSRASCTADRLCNPRWGLGYVVRTIGQSWEIVIENGQFNIGAQFPPTAQGCWFPLRRI